MSYEERFLAAALVVSLALASNASGPVATPSSPGSSQGGPGQQSVSGPGGLTIDKRHPFRISPFKINNQPPPASPAVPVRTPKRFPADWGG